MSLNFDIIDQPTPWVDRTWTTRDAMLYALGIGAGRDPLHELEFTTENSIGVTQQVFPTFATVLSGTAIENVGDFDPAMRVHGYQTVVLHRTIPPEGRGRTRTVCTGIWDKGSGALIDYESILEDARTGAVLATTRTGTFVRGEGNFGGPRGESSAPFDTSSRPPDHQMVYATRPEQALLYRLSGDHNPLHSDPVFAQRGGFERPILHGLCTYGFAGRALLHARCGSDPARFESMTARFRARVLPGDTLTVSMWGTGEHADFEVRDQDGTIVLDRGHATFR